MNKRILISEITCHQNDEKDPFRTLPFSFLPKHINSHFIAMRQNFLRVFIIKTISSICRTLRLIRTPSRSMKLFSQNILPTAALNGACMPILQNLKESVLLPICTRSGDDPEEALPDYKTPFVLLPIIPSCLRITAGNPRRRPTGLRRKQL